MSSAKSKKKQKRKGSRAKTRAAPTLIIGDCVVCQRRVKEKDQLDESMGNQEGDPLHIECATCELSKERISKVEAIRARERGEPCLSEVSKREIEETRKMQAIYHSKGRRPKKDQYLPLFPPGANLFLPVNIVGHNDMPAKGIIPMCQDTGIQFRKKEELIINNAGERVFALSKPNKKFLANRLRADIKVAAAGLDDTIVLNLKGTSAILRKPLEQEYVFKKDAPSLQFELRQAIKTSLMLTYHLDAKEKLMPIKLDQLLVSSLYFSGTLKEDFGPFLQGHEILKQEQDSRLTGKSILLEGRYEHGILYDMGLKLLFNEKENTVTPVSLQLHIRLPQV